MAHTKKGYAENDGAHLRSYMQQNQAKWVGKLARSNSICFTSTLGRNITGSPKGGQGVIFISWF